MTFNEIFKRPSLRERGLQWGFLLALLFICLSVSAQTRSKAWGNIDSHSRPWAENLSRPNNVKAGLQGRHVSIAASHGRYYNGEKWGWQRPQLFCATEDTYTQTVVVPFLMPMLENAGCYVFSPKERDWQTEEIIVDNDGQQFVTLAKNPKRLRYEQLPGYGYRRGTFADGENPFTMGYARAYPTSSKKNAPELLFDLNVTRAGSYAVYVTYPQLPDAIDDVRYIVVHGGIETEVRVNQQMGYGTWVYIGTFDFTPLAFNAIVVSTRSNKHGHVGVDAVRIGGGMGNISRGGKTSGLPRALEAARYTAQWYGAPASVYDARKGDYDDDIATRPLLANWLSGGSPFAPKEKGLRVPIELSLSVHSDAGFRKDNSHVGTLAIATTDHNGGLLDAGISRQTSLDLASTLLSTVGSDMKQLSPQWQARTVWDKNYGETRIPVIPSAIIEMHSHQNFPEMMVMQDPVGKFTMARAIYKSILRYVSEQHGSHYVVQPLPPTEFRIIRRSSNKVELSWTPVDDPQEPSARPSSYNIYIRCGDQAFNNGQNTRSTSFTVKLQPGVVYDFRVTACNAGGESFPTETLSAYIAEKEKGEILVVNGFQRLAAPYAIDNARQQGFRLDIDEGVAYGKYLGWCGRQTNFNRAEMGKSLGDSGNEMAGQLIAGNEFNYVAAHARAIAAVGRYSVVSCSSTALERALVPLKYYDCVDLAFGLQKDYSYQLRRYKTFTSSLQRQIVDYTSRGGRLFVSGAYIGSDMQQPEEQAFTASCLKYSYIPADNSSVTDQLSGMNSQFAFHHSLNADHYAAVHPEALNAVDAAFPAMLYSNGLPAATAYKGPDYAVFALGLPFECLKSPTDRATLMSAILNFLMSKK